MRRQMPGRWKPVAAVGVTAALCMPLLILGGPAFAKTGAAASQYQYSSSSQYQYRKHHRQIMICHLTRSRKHPAHAIWVSAAASNAHLRHGDHLGPCTGSETARPKKHDWQTTHNSKTTHDSQNQVTAHVQSSDSGKHGGSGEHGNHGKHGGD
jgi:hypothetical protein